MSRTAQTLQWSFITAVVAFGLLKFYGVYDATWILEQLLVFVAVSLTG